MNSRNVLILLVVLVLAIGIYMAYESQQDDIEIDLPELDLDN